LLRRSESAAEFFGTVASANVVQATMPFSLVENNGDASPEVFRRASPA